MYINLKFRIYPNKTQEAILNQQFFVANQAWNIALDIRKKDLEKKNGFTTQKIIYQASRVLEEINPAYTSQRCSKDGYISRKNRKTQAKFVCQQCGLEANADINAARNILDYDNWHLEQKARLTTKLAKSS